MQILNTTIFVKTDTKPSDLIVNIWETDIEKIKKVIDSCREVCYSIGIKERIG